MPEPDRRIRVVVDATYWRSTWQTGVERYVLLMLEALETVGDDIDATVVVRGSESAAFEALAGPGVAVAHMTSRHPNLMRVIAGLDPDLVHYPFSLPAQFTRPSVYTLHDAGRYLYPQLMVKRIRERDNDLLRQRLREPALRAVITVSQAARADIDRLLGPLRQPLTVVPNFVAAGFGQQLRQARADATPPARPFLLAIGVYMPLKNTPRLTRAFRLARRLAPDVVPDRLLLVGRRGWERGLPRAADDVVVLGNVSDAELARLYATCTAFTWPTLYEGFGLPLAEALTAGAGIMASDIPVNHEVAGPLAIYADPNDDDAMAKAIIARCLHPRPAPQETDKQLSGYTASAAGSALLETYRLAIAASGA